jgi:hypothetical protein
VLLKVALLAALFQCSPGPNRSCTQQTVGDASQPMKLTVITIEPGGNVAVVNPGDPLYLQAPPQGGYVIYAGIAGTNLEACNVNVLAELIDPASGNAVSNLDGRGANLTIARDGIYYPSDSYSMIPNIAACPDPLGQRLAGKSVKLQITTTDAGGKTDVTTVPVVVKCVNGDGACISGC